MQTIINPASIYHEVEFSYSDGTLISNAIFTEIEVQFRNIATNTFLARTWKLSLADVVLTGLNSIYVIVDTADVATMTPGKYEHIITTYENDSRFSGNTRVRKGKNNAFEIIL